MKRRFAIILSLLMVIGLGFTTSKISAASENESQGFV